MMMMTTMNKRRLSVTALIALISSDAISHKFECIIIFKTRTQIKMHRGIFFDLLTTC